MYPVGGSQYQEARCPNCATLSHLFHALNRPIYLNHVNAALGSDGLRERLFLAEHVEYVSILRGVAARVNDLESTHNYIRGCIRAYFEGSRNLCCIVGVIGDAKAHTRVIVETRFSQYVGSQSYRELMAEL